MGMLRNLIDVVKRATASIEDPRTGRPFASDYGADSFAGDGQAQVIATRWLLECDRPRVVEIDAAAFGDAAWSPGKFHREARGRDVNALVAELLVPGREREAHVVGFLVYAMRRRYVELRRLAVDPACRRRGVARHLVSRKLGSLVPEGRNLCVAEVPERLVAAQLFFRALGFRCHSTLGVDESSYAGQESYWFAVKGGQR